MGHPIRVLVAKPGLDGHDRGALVIAQGLRDQGMEVIYTGLRQTPAQIVSTALQEDVACIGLSSLSGAHMQLFPEVARLLKEQGAEDILLVGGGVIPESDIPDLIDAGITGIFTPGTRIEDVARFIREHVRESDAKLSAVDGILPGILGIDHIGIAVADVSSALLFYTRGLGLVTSHEEIVADQGVRTVFLPVGETHIELLEPTSDESPIARFLAKHGPGLHHIAYRVASVEAALEHARELGYRLIDEKPRLGGRGKLIAFLHPKSSGGVLTELCQHTDESEEGGSS
ncbi:methylmalonyl-CoA epimerase [Alicyclobacillus ferrooxydans]|uniref:Methylmalonyl-CoA epimerase n=1 Tax=Alicyclobacillus ferrooxydans TaxID=471514 RepID=A0A0P9CCX2_9BACL|nr:methylmalonyl-CoA epimerase [Alicyclobacillus ferrooxydans]KPV43512.1 methylmalonyl-CoA epimerase [Alicyclobacillus ferrooxydans]